MSFMLFCHSPDHLEIGSDCGHRFVFMLTEAAKGRRLAIGGTHWSGGNQPQNSFRVLLNAYRYASLCARDYGLA